MGAGGATAVDLWFHTTGMGAAELAPSPEAFVTACVLHARRLGSLRTMTGLLARGRLADGWTFRHPDITPAMIQAMPMAAIEIQFWKEFLGPLAERDAATSSARSNRRSRRLAASTAGRATRSGRVASARSIGACSAGSSSSCESD
jgi:hypothetical protein